MRNKHSQMGFDWSVKFFASHQYEWSMQNFAIAVLAVANFYAAQFPGLGSIESDFVDGASDARKLARDKRKESLERDLAYWNNRKGAAERAVVRQQSKVIHSGIMIFDCEEQIKAL